MPPPATGARPAYPALLDVGVWAAGAVAAAWVLRLALQVRERVLFPWDLLVWSESPFLTNLLKWDAGLPLYSDPADGNSFVYPPGGELLVWALLRPLDVHLDVRALRLLYVGLAVLAAGLAARVMRDGVVPRATGSLPGGLVLGAAAALLVHFHAFTADTVHPDNLQILHQLLVVTLVGVAARRTSLAWAAGAAVVAGLGVLTKQTEAAAVLAAAVLTWRAGVVGARGALGLAALGALVAAGTLGALFVVEPWSRLYLLDLLKGQPLLPMKAVLFLVALVQPHRLPLVLGAGWLAWTGLRSPDRRAATVDWLIALVLLGGINAPAFFKAMGQDNNLTLLDLWLVIGVWPVAARAASAAASGVRVSPVAAAVPALLLAAQWPTRLVPTDAHRAHAAATEAELRRSRAAGLRVLVPHGTMYQLHLGDHTVPIDRANSLLELNVAGRVDAPDFLPRVVAQQWDVILLDSDWPTVEKGVKGTDTCWFTASQQLLDARYQVVGVLPGVDDPYQLGQLDTLTRATDVYVPRRTP